MKHPSRVLLAAGILLAAVPAAHAALYEDLGAQDGVARIVDDATRRFLADPRVAPTFEETNMDRFKRLFTTQLCQLSGGPCDYRGRGMAASHRGLKLNQAQFNAVAEDLQDAMAAVGVGYHTQNRLMALLAPMQRDVVTQ